MLRSLIKFFFVQLIVTKFMADVIAMFMLADVMAKD